MKNTKPNKKTELKSNDDTGIKLRGKLSFLRANKDSIPTGRPTKIPT